MIRQLDTLPSIDPDSGVVTAIVETPKGSRKKYDYDPDIGAFELASVLPQGMVFPFDFGFIPSTKAEDGDPLDIMILMDEAAPTGCVVPVRVIGAIEAEQRKKGENWIRNDRLLGVSIHAHAHALVKTLSDVNPDIISQLEAFFAQYNALKAVEFRVLDRVGPKKAHKLIAQTQQ